jgi:DNA-binding FadR family transcriptional regulator
MPDDPSSHVATLDTLTIQRPKAPAMIASAIRRQIVRGDLPAGSSLPPEAELLRHYNVSRPTLREALRVLESERLISVRRGFAGAIVLEPDTDLATRYAGLVLQHRGTTVGELYEARLIFEPAAIGLLVERRRPEAVAALIAILDEEEALLRDPVAWGVIAVQFHAQLVAGAANGMLSLVAQMIETFILDLPDREARAHANDPDRRHEEHRRLVELIEVGDTAGAQTLWRAHLRASAASFGRTMNSSDLLDISAQL